MYQSCLHRVNRDIRKGRMYRSHLAVGVVTLHGEMSALGPKSYSRPGMDRNVR